MSISSQTNEEKLTAALGAEFSGAGGEGKVKMTREQKEIIENSKIEVISVGGDELSFLKAVKNHNIDSFLDRPSKLTTARPISYQVDNISTGSAAAFTETAKYKLTECKPQPNRLVPVGSIVKFTGLSVYPERCNQNVYGSVKIQDDQPVYLANSDSGFLRLREHVPQNLPTSKDPEDGTNIGWSKFTWPDTDTWHMTVEDFPQDGYYVPIYSDPQDGPTTVAVDIEAGLNNAIFPWRDDTSNYFRTTKFLSGADLVGIPTQEPNQLLSRETLQGNSARCPLDLTYEIRKVTDLKVAVP
jgi:hypothetical protein